MPKQTIEIDVPDGYEIDRLVIYPQGFGDKSGEYRSAGVFLRKKEPEYIEVREYLSRGLDGIPVLQCLNRGSIFSAEEIELEEDFIRWIDKEPRRVEI